MIPVNSNSNLKSRSEIKPGIMLIALNPHKPKHPAITSVSLLLSCLAEVKKTDVIHDLRYDEAFFCFISLCSDLGFTIRS